QAWRGSEAAPLPPAASPALPASAVVRGLAAPLYAVAPPASAAEPTGPEGSPAATPTRRAPRSPAEALHAAFQWVTGGPTAGSPEPDPARGSSAPRAALAPSSTAHVADLRAPALAPTPRADRAPAPPGQSAPRALHIGSIEVEIQPPPDAARQLHPDAGSPGAPRAPAAASAPLARGFATPLGLRQG
ncbi:MAG TPA: hypothetical protein VFT22_31865, partial [Kofleriaceae bacterium]|nr:hypothetical protein [Kofleriaceae bacterium]